jgi:hypothetical protein
VTDEGEADSDEDDSVPIGVASGLESLLSASEVPDVPEVKPDPVENEGAFQVRLLGRNMEPH